MQSPDLCLSPTLTRPLQCMTSPVAVLRNYRHNPWIGGPGVLPSPTNSLITNEDSNPPGLTSCDAIDSASDSGIDDISVAENMSPLKRTYDQQKKHNGMTAAKIIVNNNNNNANNSSNNSGANNKGYDNNKIIQIDNNNIVKINNNKLHENLKANMGLRMGPLPTTTTTSAILKANDDDDEEGASMCKRKRSISFLDSSNPLMTPFLMDLCNDDYHMNTKEYLQENDIENVLSEWPVDLV